MNYPDDTNMVSMTQMEQQLKALTVAQQATFKALADMMTLQEETHLRTIHIFEMFQNWPFAKGAKK